MTDQNESPIVRGQSATVCAHKIVNGLVGMIQASQQSNSKEQVLNDDRKDEKNKRRQSNPHQDGVGSVCVRFPPPHKSSDPKSKVKNISRLIDLCLWYKEKE